MSLYLYLSHTGQRFDVDTVQIPSPDALKQWIASHVDVPVARQILMTSTGKNVKQQHLVNHGQIFVYDKRFLLGDEPSKTTSDEETDQIPSLREPPSELENETSLQAWQQLFKSRRAWALEAVDIVRDLSERTSQSSDRCENIDQSTNVALDNLKNHVSSLQSLFEKTQAWAQDTLQEHMDMLREWRAMTETLKQLPIRDDVGKLMNTTPSENAQSDFAGTMYSLLNGQELDEAQTTLETTSNDFKSQVGNLTNAMADLQKDASSASSLMQIEWPNLETESLIQEAETLAKKIDSDYNDALRAASDTKAISKISRVAAGHTNSLLPSLQEVFQDSIQTYQNAREHKQKLSQLCFRVLRTISQTQSTLAGLQSRISSLTLSESGQQSLETLDRVFRLPSAYGNVLIEAIRRSEWNDRTVADLKSWKDELSQHKDDELRRRKKWTSSMSAFLSEDTISGSVSANAVSDFSFSTPSNPWPFVTREEIFSYIDDLRALDISDSVEQVTQQLRDLDMVAKSRRPRPRPFKNGSIHDSMQSSFINNGNNNANTEDFRTLQDNKTRLEDKLRASESRIRKLEDLLHRQSQSQSQAPGSSTTARPPSGVFSPITATDFERQPPSPGPEYVSTATPRAAAFDPSSLSRRSSVSTQPQIQTQNQIQSRRPSTHSPVPTSSDDIPTRALHQKIVALESQITALKSEADTSRRSSETYLKSLQEAEAVKRDLMANFDVHRQEFDDERQRLEDDNHEIKIKLEELEEELDRIVGSRDHERNKSEQAVSHFRSELERVRKTSEEEIERLRERREELERDLSTARERVGSTDGVVHHLRGEKSNLQDRNLDLANKLRRLEGQQADIVGILQSVHEQLSPAGSAPDDLKRLANALDVLAEGATIHTRGLDDALNLATAQGKASEEKIEHLEAQLLKLQRAKEEVEKKGSEKDDRLRQAQHSLDTLRAELTDERHQVELLRAQFAAGETGSDTLKSRLAEEEKKVFEIADARDKSEVQVEILQQNVTALREDLANLKDEEARLKLRLVGREKKAKDLSERLFQHNDRMIRMLENFGYSVSKEGAGLLIQRASKVNASQVLGDTMIGTPMKRQISGSVPVQHYNDPVDVQTLYWTHEDDDKAEDVRYDAFLSALSRLDIDSTIELITKRYKDVETLAKKYQKDSRLHREKTHRLQSEAHDKIAYRGFKEGDLALFLPTRNQATKPWAAFNVGAPHYFLKEMDVHRLQSRDWLLARISKIEERVVDLSRSMQANASTKGNADANASDGASLQSLDDNPFELSDGLRWYLIEAAEEKPGAPSTPGLGKSTVAASVIDVKAQIGRKGNGAGGKDSDKGIAGAVNVAKTLHKSLDSRRSSETSRKSAGPLLKTSTSGASAIAPLTTTGVDGEAEGTMSPAHPNAAIGPSVRPSDADARQARAREDDKIFDVTRRPGLQRAPSSSANIASPTKSIRSEAQRKESPSKTQQNKPWDRLFSFQFQA